jgi:hypothetical protein
VSANAAPTAAPAPARGARAAPTAPLRHLLEHARLLQLDNNRLQRIIRMKVINKMWPSRIITITINNKDKPKHKSY